MVEKSSLGSKSSEAEPSLAQEDSSADTGKKRPYSPPRLLSSEPLELAAGTCDPPTGPYGKAFDPGPPAVCYSLGS